MLYEVITAEASVQKRLAEAGLETGSFAHLHPASRWRFKCWPADKTAALADRIAERNNFV